MSKRVTDTLVFDSRAFATLYLTGLEVAADTSVGFKTNTVVLRGEVYAACVRERGIGRTEDRHMMRLQVHPGWEPGITWDDHTYEPGETFNIDDEDAARQFLANGSAVEARATPKRSG